MTIKNVTIGDKFVAAEHSRIKRVSTVVDFIEKKSVTTGEIVGYECIAEHILLGQVIRFVTPFSTVGRNKVK